MGERLRGSKETIAICQLRCKAVVKDDFLLCLMCLLGRTSYSTSVLTF